MLHGKAQGLVLLTATPMQVHPVEVWDLMKLLGLPPEWGSADFLGYFDTLAKPSPSHEDFDRLARLFQACERTYGELSPADAAPMVSGGSQLRAKRVLAALRDRASTPRRQLDNADRKAALALLKARTPIMALISRHTRALLRAYWKKERSRHPSPNVR